MAEKKSEARVPIVLTPNVVGGVLDHCHMPPGTRKGEYVTISWGTKDERYEWSVLSHAWILSEG